MILSTIIIDDEPHAILELEEMVARTPGITNLKSFRDVSSAVGYLRTGQHVDIIFSDIEMTDTDGLDASGILRSFCDFLIYVTAHEGFALEAFDALASGYLLKPVSQLALIKQVTSIIERKKSAVAAALKISEEDFILVKGGNKNNFVKLNARDIVMVHALLNYVKIYTPTGHVITYMGLKKVEDLLSMKPFFIRISRSVIISMRYLVQVDGNAVTIKDQGIFVVGEKYRSAFNALLQEHMLKP